MTIKQLVHSFFGKCTCCLVVPSQTETTKWKIFRSRLLPTVFLLAIIFYVGNTVIVSDSKDTGWPVVSFLQASDKSRCKIQCQPPGTESLPRGIVSSTSDLEVRKLSGTSKAQMKIKEALNKSLLAMAVGISQKNNVNRIIEKFPSSNFTVILFHYDGIVDQWRHMQWSDGVLHISAVNQTKWWFAKRFLHPDIVAEYNYIFLWDEDLGVEYFNPLRYLSIVDDEGLEISQPSLGPQSEVHHRITARLKNSRVHRRMFKFRGSGLCYKNSTAPPCTGWVEMMAPVFSRAAWRCAWYMIQNDLVHAWGLDMKLGYCAQIWLLFHLRRSDSQDLEFEHTFMQGDRTRNVGVVDAEYVIHLGVPTLGHSEENKTSQGTRSKLPQPQIGKSLNQRVQEVAPVNSERSEVRRQSYSELEIFRERWKKAVEDDFCLTDPYPLPLNQSRES